MNARMIAHDMRTPLSALTMSLQIMRGKVQPELVPQLEIAIRNADALAKIVEAFVDCGPAGFGTLHLQKCLPLDLVTTAVDQIVPLAQGKRQSVTTGEMVALPPLVADATRIVRVLVNLLSNAVRFSPEGGHIRVAAKKRNNDGHQCVVFSVCDDGPGVDLKDIERIFVEGVSIAKGGNSSNGLGLAVCKELVEAHNGRLWVEPEQPKGAVFSFSIPIGLHPTDSGDSQHLENAPSIVSADDRVEMANTPRENARRP